jgi:hypothetical protein
MLTVPDYPVSRTTPVSPIYIVTVGGKNAFFLAKIQQNKLVLLTGFQREPNVKTARLRLYRDCRRFTVAGTAHHKQRVVHKTFSAHVKQCNLVQT